MKKLIPGLVLLAAVGACSDGPTAPPEATSIQITAAGSPVSERTLQVGSTTQLDAAVRMSDETGTPSPVVWMSSVPGVADVNSVGLVTGISVGEALIVASADRVADTIRVVVTAPPPAAVACAPDDPVLRLQRGEVHQVQANQSPLLCLPGDQSGAEYVVIPFNASATATTSLTLLGGNVSSPALPLFPSVARTERTGPRLASASAMMPQEDWGFHRQLREAEKTLLRNRSDRAIRPLSSMARASVPSVGEIISLNGSTVACRDTERLSAQVEAVSERAIVVADLSNPENGFDRDDYQQFAEEFDSFVWPITTENFGTPSDIDQNGRVIIFFTRAVNDLTEVGSGSYVGGFYHPRDLLSRSECPGSNAGEVLYQLVPDPARVDSTAETFMSTEQVQRRTMAVVAHELQHLVNTSIRMFTLDAPGEEVWLNEALSHIAEELLFYEESGLAPQQNITLETLRRSSSTLDAVNRHQISNISRFMSFLESPHRVDLSDGNELVTRGAMWSFLRYAADRHASPGEQQQIWRSLVSSQQTGITNVSRVFGIYAFDWLQDWTVAVLADDTGLPVAPRFRHPSWDFRSVVAGLEDPPYPLHTRMLVNNQPVSIGVQPGGTAYFRLRVAGGLTGGVRISSEGANLPQTMRLSIIRTN